MYFCDSCERCLKRDTTSGSVMYRCDVCSLAVAGDPASFRLGGETFGARKERGRNARLLRLCTADRASSRKKRDCPECGLDYMSMARLGPSETVAYACKCGHLEHPR